MGSGVLELDVPANATWIEINGTLGGSGFTVELQSPVPGSARTNFTYNTFTFSNRTVSTLYTGPLYPKTKYYVRVTPNLASVEAPLQCNIASVSYTLSQP